MKKLLLIVLILLLSGCTVISDVNNVEMHRNSATFSEILDVENIIIENTKNVVMQETTKENEGETEAQKQKIDNFTVKQLKGQYTVDELNAIQKDLLKNGLYTVILDDGQDTIKVMSEAEARAYYSDMISKGEIINRFWGDEISDIYHSIKDKFDEEEKRKKESIEAMKSPEQRLKEEKENAQRLREQSIEYHKELYDLYMNDSVMLNYPLGNEDVDFMYLNKKGNFYRKYRLGCVDPKNYDKANEEDKKFNLYRTDFADGLQDNDGNGIDDRDPINVMGCFDLNHDGIDDRSYCKQTSRPNGQMKVFIQGPNDSHFSYRYNFECPHGVINKNYASWNVQNLKLTREELWQLKSEHLCPICREMQDDERKRLLNQSNAVKNAGGAAEYCGYTIGSVVKLKDGHTVTYEGKQTWRREDGKEMSSILSDSGELSFVMMGGIG